MSEERSATGADPNAAVATVVAWDLPTRLFHWLLVMLIVLAWVSRKWGDEGLVWHKWNGYAILVLIVWRVIWGFTGSSTARFRSFFYWPWTAASYGLDFALRRPRHFLGHNPLGGSVVLLMLGIIALQGVLGLYSYDDHSSNAGGPLAGKVSDATWAAATKWHLFMFDVILAVIALHVIANLLYLIWKGENLIKPMITGRKAQRDYEDQPQATIARVGHAVLALIAAVLLVFGGIMTLGGKVF
ncbi:MAG: cytochrome b/b6 domain-containing protein [Hyphomicrobiaceae bacterium]